MSGIDLQGYESRVYNIHHLFDKTEEGFFVPLYQREYTWVDENINQFFEDLVLGIWELSNKNDKNAVTFFGTLIFTNLVDKTTTVKKGEDNAQPTAVQLVIDGQQRISTIALLAIQLRERLKSFRSKLPDGNLYKVLRNHCDDLKDEKLPKLYTIKLGRGANPPKKPKIISAKGEDRWTYDGGDESYGSPVAHYIATYIREEDLEKAFDSIVSVRVHKNVKLINRWLDGICSNEPGSLHDGQFPTDTEIVSDRMQEYILGYKSDQIRNVIGQNCDNSSHIATQTYRLFLLAYYLLNRCAVNRLQPPHEDWGFDMFQALNATGTPLTAMETFLPNVMRAEKRVGNEWEKTPSSEHMDEIEQLFKATNNNQQKSRRTNELLNTFALCYEGKKLGNKFSTQRRWITDIYENNLQNLEEKREFLRHLADVGKFFYVAWYMEDNPGHIMGLEHHEEEGNLVPFLIRYLKDANSKLSAPILARYYSQAVRDEKYMDEFVEAVKACAAFFTLWRSARSATGLDKNYRNFFRGDKGNKHNWLQPKQVSSKSLKEHFLDVLRDNQIYEKDSWIEESKRFLLYTEVKVICRFVLFLAGHDRAGDDTRPGLTTSGNTGVCSLLNLEKWLSKNYKSLEHIAPQKPPKKHNWDRGIYTGNKVHEVGNLLLLRTEVNRLADNKNWVEKFLYYSHVGKSRDQDIKELREEAEKEGIRLSEKAIKELLTTPYARVVEPVLTLGKGGRWDARMIDERTNQIKEIAWEKLTSWLKI